MIGPVFDFIRHLFSRETRDAGFGSPFANPWGPFASVAGFGANTEGVLRSPTALACIRGISEAAGSLPIHVVRTGENGTGERDTSSPLATLLDGDWCPWLSATESVSAIQMDALTHGYGAGLVIKAGGVPREIHRLEPTTVARDWTGPEPVYRVNGQTYGWDEVLWIATPGSAGWRIINLANECREAIALDILMADHQRRMFTRGARPAGLLEYAKALSPEVAARLKASFASTHSGEGSGGTLILEDGMQFKQLAFSSVDSQFLELRKFVAGDIARAFKVPATLIGDLERATWRNVEELGRQFVTFSLMPWLKVWQAALGRVALTPAERATTAIRFDVDALQQADIAGRFAAYRNATAARG